MRNFRWRSAWSFIWLAFGCPSLPVGATPLSLKEALTFALEHSPDYNTAQRQADIAELQRKNAISSFLPSLDLSAIHGLNKTYFRGPR